MNPRTAPVLQLTAGAALALGVPDVRLLSAVGYLPLILWYLVTGRAEQVAAGLSWALPVQVAALAVGGLLIVRGLRGLDLRPRHSRATYLRRGRRWVALAVIVPTAYAVTRYAWWAGIPFGISPETLTQITPIVSAGAVLASFGMVGALLTTGLVASWGERLPRWVPGLGGRPVPVRLAVVPACVAAVLVTTGGFSFVRLVITSDPGRLPGEITDVAAWLPEMFWPLWGLGLVGAAWCYRQRRALTGEPARVPAGARP